MQWNTPSKLKVHVDHRPSSVRHRARALTKPRAGCTLPLPGQLLPPRTTDQERVVPPGAPQATMKTHSALGIDTDNHRSIELSVSYTPEGGQTEVHTITPQRVTFQCRTTGKDQRSIGVHTDGGRRMLIQHFRQRVSDVELENLLNEGTPKPSP
jgi:hypothetical protein